MDYRVDLLSSRPMDRSCSRYSTFPGRRYSHTLQHDSTASYQLENSSSDPNTWMALRTRAHNETPLATTYPPQRRLSRRELADYIGEVRNLVLREQQRSDTERYGEEWKSTWPKRWRGTRDRSRTICHGPQGSAFGDWRSSTCPSAIENMQRLFSPEIGERFQPTAHKIDRTEREQNPWISRNVESTCTAQSFRQPPSYTPPPAYSSPKDGGPKETCHDASANNGQYSQKYSQMLCSSGGEHKPATPQAPPKISPDVTKQTKLSRRRGGETVFCLVSRMGEVSGLSSSPEEPLRSCVLPLLTGSKPDEKTTDSPQRDEAEKQIQNRDQSSSSGQDVSTKTNPDENREKLQSSDSQLGHEKPWREIIEKFPLWKEPKHQHHSTEMKQGSNQESPEIIDESVVTNTEDGNNSTNDQQHSLVVIDASCVVVKVELVLLPEKEHVQYVCLAEEAIEENQHSSADTSLKTPENLSLEEREDPGEPLEETGEQSIQHEQDSQSHTERPVEETEQSEPADHQNENRPTLANNGDVEDIIEDQTTARAPEGTLEDFTALTEASGPTDGATEQENGPTLHKPQEDNENCEKDLTENASIEDNDLGELVVDCSTPLPQISAETGNDIQDCLHQDDSPTTTGTSPLQRSSSSPALSSFSDTLDGPNISDMPVLSLTEDEAQFIPSSSNSDVNQCPSSPSIQMSCASTPSSTPDPDATEDPSLAQEVSLCTSSPSEHSPEPQKGRSLWDAVSRIRRHTAPDSETEEEEDTAEDVDTDCSFRD